VLFKDNKVLTSQSELYHANGATAGYDSLNQLAAFSRKKVYESGLNLLGDPSSKRLRRFRAVGTRLVMNIEEAISQFSKMPEDSVLVARAPLTWGAEALFTKLDDDYRVPQQLKDAGYEYLLGRDDIANLTELLKKKKVSKRTVAEFVIYFSINDSVPAWIDDIPDV